MRRPLSDVLKDYLEQIVKRQRLLKGHVNYDPQTFNLAQSALKEIQKYESESATDESSVDQQPTEPTGDAILRVEAEPEQQSTSESAGD